jgi:predicted DNA-binding protein
MTATKSYSLDLETITTIQKIAERTGKSRGRIITEAIAKYDESFDDDGEIDPAFAAEVKREFELYKAGKIKPIPFGRKH